MALSLLVAMAENGVIGRDNALPWHLPNDLKRFKALTTGRSILMGRRTFESIGRVLPERRTIVITRNPDFRAPGAEVAHTLDDALALTEGEDEVFVVGGAELYRSALVQAERIYLTMVHASVEGDVRFPAWNHSHWRLVEFVRYGADARHVFPYSFRRYDRTPGAGERRERS
ncbi:MAG: dihydrofolate reductase [Gemmatimonadales bacterium]|nr:dihydrofolate reductase [Gemmatimonadales bacterium]